jgi:hypothetical protein
MNTKLRSYIVRVDTGLAPNPFWGFCTLALCTPNHQGSIFTGVNIANAEQKMNRVKITTNPVPTFSSEETTQIRDFLSFTNERDYDILPNGRQLLMIFPANQTPTQQTPRPRIQVVLNWFTELQERVPVK